ncbi:hypothetical protein FAZ15_21800 [Sphingobacterium olei]|uniref:TonB C-terminal domain-containing protein n=1 Tax=Sphingobacterium olei TaxID=2571155 RepID=A0A4U0N8T1_9SPHI|nr:hypothetical protein [Sphingobacterium olei]TJZ50056.1 hypothetical protein FAZ15_21800 [Sphingobacterium olei]
MNYLLCCLLISLSLQCCAQKGKTTNLEKTQASLPDYYGGPYEHYAFVLDGKIIGHSDIVGHVGAIPYKIFPNAVIIEKREYHGVLYLSTSGYNTPPLQYAGDSGSDEPVTLGQDCLCYIADFDTTSKAIAYATELKPQPYEGEIAYLEKLSQIIGLSAENTVQSTFRDSISVQFIVTKTGMLALLEPIGSQKPEHENLLQAIKRHSCTWSLAMNSGRTLLFRRKMTIFYTKDKNGNIQSLDSLAYKYDG